MFEAQQKDPSERLHRLQQRADYTRVFQLGRRSADTFFTVLSVVGDPHAPSRLGLAISKKNIKLAHDRSRLKRIIRESFRRFARFEHPLDCVVSCRPAARFAEHHLLFQSLARHWQEHDLLHRPWGELSVRAYPPFC